MYEVHITDLATGKLVKKLSYRTYSLANKALVAVLNRINLEEFTADVVERELSK